MQAVFQNKKAIISIVSILMSFFCEYSRGAERVGPFNATNETIVVVESFIGDILIEVQNGLGYADSRAKSNRIFFNAWLNGQTNGYSYSELVDIVNAGQSLILRKSE